MSTLDELLNEYAEAVYKLLTTPKATAWDYIKYGQEVEACKKKIAQFVALCALTGSIEPVRKREDDPDLDKLPVEDCGCDLCEKRRAQLADKTP